MHRHTTAAPAITILLAATLASTAACRPLAEAASATHPASPSAPSGNVGAARGELAALAVKPEDTGAHYDRDDWPHWDTTHGACDAREDALIAQGRDVRTDARCHPVSGTWVSPYDGVTVTDPGKLDIDHLVPLAEVARSGARGWSRAQREHYANDPAVLVVVTAHANRAKGDQDPAKWLPERDRCGYVAHWIEVKTRYQLTVDQAEHDALAAVLAHCPDGGER
ncbi:Protein of unknown function [Amycolatopsis sacchari]|uniref:GmrSD restriction endonucleases C-terminal domain-containing protein n=1 Tax=Amycolatopsis sacchari TaxID=115433 RepID=A0A1I4A905_9PSEU|nr:HNH endonuclease family protein [Amycolatopsis sacchari]SFK52441.1 Protein of unknown function [Amycolatopsis sacchari]